MEFENFEKNLKQFINSQILILNQPLKNFKKLPKDTEVSPNVVNALISTLNVERSKQLNLHFTPQSKMAVIEQLVELKRIKDEEFKRKSELNEGNKVIINFNSDIPFWDQLPNQWPTENNSEVNEDLLKEYESTLITTHSLISLRNDLLHKVEHYKSLIEVYQDLNMNQDFKNDKGFVNKVSDLKSMASDIESRLNEVNSSRRNDGEDSNSDDDDDNNESHSSIPKNIADKHNLNMINLI